MFRFEQLLESGVINVYKKIWDSLELDDVLDKTIKNKNIRLDFKNVIFLTAIAKLQGISNKLDIYSVQDKFYGVKKISVNSRP